MKGQPREIRKVLYSSDECLRGNMSLKAKLTIELIGMKVMSTKVTATAIISQLKFLILSGHFILVEECQIMLRGTLYNLKDIPIGCLRLFSIGTELGVFLKISDNNQ